MKKFAKLSAVKMSQVKGGALKAEEPIKWEEPGPILCYGVPTEPDPWEPIYA